MIHIFNRAELCITEDLLYLDRICAILEVNRIPYRLKSDAPLGNSVVRSGRPGATFGKSPQPFRPYVLYVRQKDLEYAIHLIQTD